MLTRRMRPPTIANYDTLARNRWGKILHTKRLEEIISITSLSGNSWVQENPTHFKKSRVGCAEWTDHQLLANTLKILRTITRNAADHLALNPTATITQAARPTMDTKTRMMLHSPWIMKPKKRKMSSTRPARRKLKAEDHELFGNK